MIGGNLLEVQITYRWKQKKNIYRVKVPMQRAIALVWLIHRIHEPAFFWHKAPTSYTGIVRDAPLAVFVGNG